MKLTSGHMVMKVTSFYMDMKANKLLYSFNQLPYGYKKQPVTEIAIC